MATTSRIQTDKKRNRIPKRNSKKQPRKAAIEKTNREKHHEKTSLRPKNKKNFK
jgi:hypothetical protein